jgi:hypothetical protein
MPAIRVNRDDVEITIEHEEAASTPEESYRVRVTAETTVAPRSFATSRALRVSIRERV